MRAAYRCRVIAVCSCLCAFLVGAVRAQYIDRHLDPARLAEDRRIRKIEADGTKVICKARALLRAGRYEEARTCAHRAEDIYRLIQESEPFQTSFEAPAHAVLADCDLLEKRYAEALQEVSLAGPEIDSYLSLTEAIALGRLGRREDALAALEGQIGSKRGERATKGRRSFWDTPIDRSPSPDAITATALLVRSQIATMGTNLTDMQNDLEAAALLAPNNPSIELHLAECLMYQKHYDAAKRHAVAALNGGGAETKKAARGVFEGTDTLRRADQAAVDRGTPIDHH